MNSESGKINKNKADQLKNTKVYKIIIGCCWHLPLEHAGQNSEPHKHITWCTVVAFRAELYNQTTVPAANENLWEVWKLPVLPEVLEAPQFVADVADQRLRICIAGVTDVTVPATCGD